TQVTGKTPLAADDAAKKTKTVAASKSTAKTTVKAGESTKAEKAPAKKVAAKKTATKTATAKAAAGTTGAASKTTARKTAAKVPTGRRPGRPAKNANNDSADFNDDDNGDAEVIPELKPLPKRGGKRGKADK